jgi:hypothetical protein
MRVIPIIRDSPEVHRDAGGSAAFAASLSPSTSSGESLMAAFALREREKRKSSMSMKKKRVKKGAYVDFNGMKLSPTFFDAFAQDRQVTVGFDPCVPYEADHPWVFDRSGPVAPLHVCVWDFFHSSSRPRKDGEHVHHIDHDVMNATIENLGIGSPAAHGKAHAMRRQKFTPRKRWRLFGFFRPRAEEPIRTLDGEELDAYKGYLLAQKRARQENRQALLDWLEVIKNLRSSSSSPTSTSPGAPRSLVHSDEAAEWVLAQALPQLRAELDHLDSGKKIAPPTSRPRSSDRLHDIGRIRRGCTPGEAALVRLLVKHGFDIEKAAEEIGLSVRVLMKMKKETSVDLAIRNWHDEQRLPPPCSEKKLRPYMRSKKTSRG